MDEGAVASVAYGPGGALAAGLSGRRGGVVVFNGDASSWIREAGRIANRNLTMVEWKICFPDVPYRRTVRSLPWPDDLSEPDRSEAIKWEEGHSQDSTWE